MTLEDPLRIALHEITETRLLLESLLSGSEGFDYREAKKALRKLQAKSKALAKLEAEYQARVQAREPNLCFVDFRKGGKQSDNNETPRFRR